MLPADANMKKRRGRKPNSGAQPKKANAMTFGRPSRQRSAESRRFGVTLSRAPVGYYATRTAAWGA
jgi:hypothetical protein